MDFVGSQLNWATLTMEGHAKYIPVKKLPYNLKMQHLPLKSEHLPLKKFL